jgi:hypothetical protein
VFADTEEPMTLSRMANVDVNVALTLNHPPSVPFFPYIVQPDVESFGLSHTKKVFLSTRDFHWRQWPVKWHYKYYSKKNPTQKPSASFVLVSNFSFFLHSYQFLSIIFFKFSFSASCLYVSFWANIGIRSAHVSVKTFFRIRDRCWFRLPLLCMTHLVSILDQSAIPDSYPLHHILSTRLKTSRWVSRGIGKITRKNFITEQAIISDNFLLCYRDFVKILYWKVLSNIRQP